MESNSKTMQNKKQLTFIEVCAGAGGLSKGFIDAGFNALLLNKLASLIYLLTI